MLNGFALNGSIRRCGLLSGDPASSVLTMRQDCETNGDRTIGYAKLPIGDQDHDDRGTLSGEPFQENQSTTDCTQ